MEAATCMQETSRHETNLIAQHKLLNLWNSLQVHNIHANEIPMQYLQFLNGLQAVNVTLSSKSQSTIQEVNNQWLCMHGYHLIWDFCGHDALDIRQSVVMRGQMEWLPEWFHGATFTSAINEGDTFRQSIKVRLLCNTQDNLSHSTLLQSRIYNTKIWDSQILSYYKICVAFLK